MKTDHADMTIHIIDKAARRVKDIMHNFKIKGYPQKARANLVANRAVNRQGCGRGVTKRGKENEASKLANLDAAQFLIVVSLFYKDALSTSKITKKEEQEV